MIGINYQSEDLFTTNQKYKLSSIITEGNLLFCISRLNDNKIVAVKEISRLKNNYYLDKEYLEELFIQNNLTHKSIKKISIANLTPEFSIVPEDLDTNDTDVNPLQAVSIKQYYPHFEIKKSHIKSIAAYNYFPFPKVFSEFLNSTYESVSYFHANDVLVDNFQKYIDKKDILLANLNENYLQILTFKGGLFTQANVYKIKTKDDILYYILANLSNHAIPLNLANVILAGRMEKKSAIFNLLYDHIKNLTFIKDLPRIAFSNVFLGKPKHLFYDIYSLCEL